MVELARQERQVSLFQLGKNLGYYGGAALALEQYLAASSLPEWVIVSNTDISFEDDQFLARLISHYETDSPTTPAIIAPAITSTRTGVDQNPYMRRRPSRLQMHFYKWVFQFYISLTIYELLSHIKSWLISKIKHNNSNLTNPAKHSIKPTRIYAPHGSFTIFNRRYFEAGGTLNYEVFLFGEEIFVAETAWRLGLSIVYDPRLKVIHTEHSTTGFFSSRKMAKYVAEAAAYCADTFF